MAIQNGQERLLNITQAMHNEIDKLMATPRLVGFKIEFEAGVDRVLTAKTETITRVGDLKQALVMTEPTTQIETENGEGDK